MPRSKKSKRIQRKGVPHGKISANSASAAIPYAQSTKITPIYQFSTVGSGSNQVVRMRIRDLVRLAADHTSLRESIAMPFNLDTSHLSAQGYAEILPKLQAFASAFSRYKVNTARLHWQPMCSAAAAGSVGLALVPGLATAPGGPVTLVSYANSAVGPVWCPMVTPLWRNMESRWFHLRHSAQAYLSNSFNVEEIVPFTILYGNINGYSNASGITDLSGSINGLLWLDISIDFCDMAAPPPLSLSLQLGTEKTVSSASSAVSWKTLNNMIGWFDWGADLYKSYTTDGVVGYPISAGAGWVTEAVPAIEWFGDFVLSATAAPMDSKRESDYEVLRRPDDRSSNPVLSLDPMDKQVPRRLRKPRGAPPNYAPGVVDVYVASTADGVPGDYSGPVRRSRGHVGAAGDVTVSLMFQPARTGAVLTTVYAATFSPGTGAAELNGQWSGAVSEAGTFFVKCAPTGSEVRNLSDTSSMSYDVIATRTSYA